MEVQLLYFAALRERAGKSEETLLLPVGVTDIRTLIAHLNTLPALQGQLASVRVALNEEFAEPDQRLRDGDVIALIPPVQGG